MDNSIQSSVVSRQIFARYVGNGAFINGIPARDLTRDEYNALDRDQRDQILSSNLYDIAESEPKARAATIKE